MERSGIFKMILKKITLVLFASYAVFVIVMLWGYVYNGGDNSGLVVFYASFWAIFFVAIFILSGKKRREGKMSGLQAAKIFPLSFFRYVHGCKFIYIR